MISLLLLLEASTSLPSIRVPYSFPNNGHDTAGNWATLMTLSLPAKRLEEVLKHLLQHGLHVKKSNCCFLQSSVGHCTDAEGLHPTEKKLKAIVEAPAPKTIQDLHCFLGLINYQMSSCTTTLIYPFAWPEMLLLMELELWLHELTDGTEHPVAFASHTLMSSENYVQVEKEALLLIFSIFIRTSTGNHSPSLQITNPLPRSLVQERVFLRSLLPDYKGGLGFCQHITIRLNFVLQGIMEMLMGCLTCHWVIFYLQIF